MSLPSTTPRSVVADVDAITFYYEPLTKLNRLVETYLAFGREGFRSFVMARAIWLKHKLYLKETLRRELSEFRRVKKRELPKLLFADHHQSHAGAAARGTAPRISRSSWSSEGQVMPRRGWRTSAWPAAWR